MLLLLLFWFVFVLVWFVCFNLGGGVSSLSIKCYFLYIETAIASMDIATMDTDPFLSDTKVIP